MPLIGRHIVVRGVVQGVGFRPWVYQLARRHGVGGRVRNDSAGVMIDAFGGDDAVAAFSESIGRNTPPASRVRDVRWEEIPWENVTDFAIIASEAVAERNVSIPPDLATCDDCLAEIFDPSNRRYLYPFTNCTNCGPRYTIIRDVPYDRAQTTMASFNMCGACREEYDDPLDRRFHAQPNACPTCGPRVAALRPQGYEIATHQPIEFAARALRSHLIVAVKGLGGFHLACDATSSLAVTRLRERKRREAKPLAVMVRDLEAAEAVAELSQQERELLTSVERPIVLVKRRAGARLALEIAGDSPLVGIFLPYTPLHHILLREAGVPLVMTSGNTTDEPMATDTSDALERLGQIADVFLVHDRPIETRADDSVTRVIAGVPTVMRRARGYVPRGIDLGREFAQPVLAVGAHLKNAICIGTGRSAFLGPHIGDLETLETLRSFEQSVEQMKRFIGVDPKLIAHDLHPDYFSTRYAEALGDGSALIGVQHHHAHIVSAMAEHGIDGRAIGVAYDGTGFGTDGTSWGGEILIADYTRFKRFATFRPIPLAGGDQAIRQVWRIALALLDDAFDGAPPLHRIPLFRGIEQRLVGSVRTMIANGLNVPRARGVGRYFDALGALVLGVDHSRYEGEVALQWNIVADEHEDGRYEVVVREGATPWEIDLRPLVRDAVRDLLSGASAGIISARFHNTLADLTIEVAQAAAAVHGPMPVVLSGGCFQNAMLAERVTRGLRSTLDVVMNHTVPPGDGGLALGQAVIADAISRAESVSDWIEEDSVASADGPAMSSKESRSCV